MKKFALISLCGATLFTACSDDSTSNVKISVDESDIIAKTYDDLPVCSDSREGMFAFIKDEMQGYTCHNKIWAPYSKIEDESSSSEISSSSEADNIEEPTSSAAEETSSSEAEDSSSSVESSSSEKPESSAESSSSEEPESSSSFESRDINVGVYQYEFSGMDFLNVNIYNNEIQAIDSLTLYLFVTAKPEKIEIAPGVDKNPGTCPLVVDEDICIMYDSRGFSTPCNLPGGKSADLELRTNLRQSTPIKIANSYNALTGEYTYYIPIPLGSIELAPSTHMRIDIGFTSGIYQNANCETLRTPAKKKLSKDSGDWSWVAHQKNVDGADYEGIPLLDRDYGDTGKAPINPYIVIYRNDELISGIPPKF